MARNVFIASAVALLALQVSARSIDNNDLDPSAIWVSYPQNVRCPKTRFPTYQESPNGRDYFYRCSLGFASEYQCPTEKIFNMQSHKCSSQYIQNADFIDLENGVNMQALDDGYDAFYGMDRDNINRDSGLKNIDTNWLRGVAQDEGEFKPQAKQDTGFLGNSVLYPSIKNSQQIKRPVNKGDDSMKTINARHGTDAEAEVEFLNWLLESEEDKIEPDTGLIGVPKKRVDDDDNEAKVTDTEAAAALLNWLLESEEDKIEPDTGLIEEPEKRIDEEYDDEDDEDYDLESSGENDFDDVLNIVNDAAPKSVAIQDEMGNVKADVQAPVQIIVQYEQTVNVVAVVAGPGENARLIEEMMADTPAEDNSEEPKIQSWYSGTLQILQVWSSFTAGGFCQLAGC